MRVLGIDYERSENAAVAQQFLESTLVDEYSFAEVSISHKTATFTGSLLVISLFNFPFSVCAPKFPCTIV